MPAPEFNGLPRNLVTALLHPWTWRMAWRDSRTQRQRLVIFSLAIVSGIAALVAIHSLKASVQAGIVTQAKALLGSDLQVSSRRPIAEADAARLAGMARSLSRETSFPSMLKFLPGGAARLVQVRGIEGAYPYYGEVVTRPTDAWKLLADEPGVLLEPALLEQFQAKIGDEVELGNLRLKVLGVVDKPAPRASRFGAFAPEAYVRLRDLAGSGLLGTTSMSSHQVYLEIPGGLPSQALKDKIRAEFPDEPWRLETPDDRRENLGDALENF
ncbi:MAG: ABC transporter permease, partial [Akkermansiaceae bacterium]